MKRNYCRSRKLRWRAEDGEWMIMVESGEVEVGGRVSYKRKGKKSGRLEKAMYDVIEFLLQLISHIHFIISSLLHTTVGCRKFVLIRLCIQWVYTFVVYLCVTLQTQGVRLWGEFIYSCTCMRLPKRVGFLQNDWHYISYSAASPLLTFLLLSFLLVIQSAVSLTPCFHSFNESVGQSLYYSLALTVAFFSLFFHSQKTTRHLYRDPALGRILMPAQQLWKLTLQRRPITSPKAIPPQPGTRLLRARSLAADTGTMLPTAAGWTERGWWKERCWNRLRKRWRLKQSLQPSRRPPPMQRSATESQMSKLSWPDSGLCEALVSYYLWVKWHTYSKHVHTLWM